MQVTFTLILFHRLITGHGTECRQHGNEKYHMEIKVFIKITLKYIENDLRYEQFSSTLLNSLFKLVKKIFEVELENYLKIKNTLYGIKHIY